jgi:UDP-N-acetylglucosamine diphosphorylase / glucose-1-phosphate thymidylyltransferase / UDP-N-acetylgalactosamine diphosphorylase / glucosamine-1-phosphate N-acetyltransferase / galactosamine-1-phosphate N-acetyltransferase
MKIVIGMAGLGSRLADLSPLPKPLIPIAGRPMIAWALDSLADLEFSEIIFVALAEHQLKFGVTERLRELAGNKARTILLDGPTEGQLCTILSAKERIDSDESLLVASADTYVRSELGRHLSDLDSDCRGVISVAEMGGDQWSFARLDDNGRVLEVTEKVRISDQVSTGLYYFSSGREFVEIGSQMVSSGMKSKGEYYVMPVYSEYLKRGWRVDASRASMMMDMGSPKALAEFELWAQRNQKRLVNEHS